MFQYSVILGNVGQCSDRYMTCGYGRPFELPELFERVASIPGVTGIEYIGSWHLSDKTVHQIADLQKQYGLTYLFIGHDLSVINFIADRVCVMFLGHVCEVATKEELYSRPMHPYTAGLMAAVSSLARGNGALEIIPGAVPNLLHLPAGCSFSPRCSKCSTHCGDVVPELREVSSGHLVRCINIPEVRL